MAQAPKSSQQYQLEITDFFTRVPKQFPKPLKRPKKGLQQATIPQLFDPQYVARQKAKRRKAHRRIQQKLYRWTILSFRQHYEKEHEGYTFMCSRNGLCYYRQNFEWFFVVDPETGSKVCELELDDNYWLTRVETKPHFQKKGIASWLMRCANKVTEGRVLISMGKEFNSRYRLTEEGMKLVVSCLRRDIIKEEQLSQESLPSPAYTPDY